MRQAKLPDVDFHHPSERRVKPELRYTGTWWYQGTEADWRSLPLTERERLAFEHTKCLYAYPTWSNVDCAHIDCRIARGEVPPIAKVNAQLRSEKETGWLRFITDRSKLATIFRAHRRIARQTGINDIWSKDAWALTVYSGITA